MPGTVEIETEHEIDTFAAVPGTDTRSSASQEFSELLWCQSGIAHDSTQGERIDRIVAGYGENSSVVGHNDVLALTGDSESCLLERAHGVEMVDSGDARHD